jgi:lysophospholipase L1-like esterase
VTPALLAGDGNHPNAAGYEQITDIWFNAIAPQVQ